MCAILISKHYCNQMVKVETITSSANPLLKDVRRAASRGALTEQGWCIAESFHLLEEALRSDCEVHAVLASESARAAVEEQLSRAAAIRLLVLPDALLDSIAATETPQGVIALVKLPEWTLDDLLREDSLVVVLAGVQDPGNAGTIVRAAEAFGATGARFLKGTTSVHNPKTLRASAGSLFRLAVVSGLDGAAARLECERRGIAVLAGVPAGRQSRSVTAVDLTRPSALVIGSEAHGPSADMLAGSTAVSIPTAGVESLNAAMAAAILLYEARRQRTAKP
jgi:TrmH family RNA methyltransferase